MLSHRNPKRIIRRKQVQCSHTNVAKRTRVEALDGEQEGERKKTWFKEILGKNPGQILALALSQSVQLLSCV